MDIVFKTEHNGFCVINDHFCLIRFKIDFRTETVVKSTEPPGFRKAITNILLEDTTTQAIDVGTVDEFKQYLVNLEKQQHNNISDMCIYKLFVDAKSHSIKYMNNWISKYNNQVILEFSGHGYNGANRLTIDVICNRNNVYDINEYRYEFNKAVIAGRLGQCNISDWFTRCYSLE